MPPYLSSKRFYRVVGYSQSWHDGQLCDFDDFDVAAMAAKMQYGDRYFIGEMDGKYIYRWWSGPDHHGPKYFGHPRPEPLTTKRKD